MTTKEPFKLSNKLFKKTYIIEMNTNHNRQEKKVVGCASNAKSPLPSYQLSLLCRALALTIFLFTHAKLLALTTADSVCNDPLLSEARLHASSELSRDRGANEAILNSASAWTAATSDFSQFLVIDLGKKYNITSLASQGRAFSSEYVSEFKLDYGYDGTDFAPYRDRSGNIRLFEANSDDRNIVENMFDAPLIAQYIRIQPTSWHNRISMRFQLFGCSYSSEVLGFDGSSIILHDLRSAPINSFEDHVNFRFRTSQPDGSILFASGESGDLLAVQLIDNKLSVSIGLGSGKIETSIASSLLDDNTWHDVAIDRHGRQLAISVDRVLFKCSLTSTFERLNLDYDLWIGGLPQQPATNLIGLDSNLTQSNFTGCIENLLINGTSISSELREEIDYSSSQSLLAYRPFGYIYRFCMHQPTLSMTFNSNETYFSVEGYQLQTMNVSFSFRTFVENGVLLYSKFSVGESITIQLRDGKLVVSIQGDSGPLVNIEPIPKLLNDGAWHSVRTLARENYLMVVVDNDQSVTRRKLRFQSGREYFIGGYPELRAGNSLAGFIGCMRLVHIEGRFVSFASIPNERMHKRSDMALDACQIVDKCHPNPCKHNGLCRQDHTGFSCDCTNTGYLGAVCHVPEYHSSCEAYRTTIRDSSRLSLNVERERERDVLIDVDGSGPLMPAMVTCRFGSGGTRGSNNVQTIIHHKSEEEILVQGASGKGSFVEQIEYPANSQFIRTIIERSNACSQYVRFSCMNTRLLNSGGNSGLAFDPFTWWVGANNQRMDYWPGALPGSGVCACGLDGTCADPSKACNCDSLNAHNGLRELTDDGLITRSDHLPVKRVHVGDTGSFASPSRYAKLFVGPLICEGNSNLNEPITFKYDDASISLPSVYLNDANDIYLQFKTTASSGVLLSAKTFNETIKLAIVNEKSIQFIYSSVKDALPLTVESSYRFNDNNWHSVTIERNRKEIKLAVDGQISANARSRVTATGHYQHHLSQSSDWLSNLNNNIEPPTQITIGATEDFNDGFIGCMRSFTINGSPIDLSRYARDGASTYGILAGCRGKCDGSNPCQNKGVCIEGYSIFTCDCQWTAYKGPLCADEIGANLRSDNYIRYDFDTSLSTVEETIKLGFTTSEHRGLIIGITSHTGEYLNVLMSNSGHLKLEFDFGFERKEEVIGQENFALGQHHDLTIRRMSDGSKLVVAIDNYEPSVFTYRISKDADAKFDQLKSIYIGRNETMDVADGFIGCISHVSFDDHFPLRFLFQDVKRSNVHGFPSGDIIREDTCGIEPIRIPVEKREKRPIATTRDSTSTRIINISVEIFKLLFITLIFVTFILAFLLYVKYQNREKGHYITREDSGAKEALDPDTAVVLGVTGPLVAKKQEYFI